MTTGTRPAVDPAWVYPTSLLTAAQRRARAEAVLSRRKDGVPAEAIGAALGLTRKIVMAVIAEGRQHADARALNDAQAAKVRHARACEARMIAEREAAAAHQAEAAAALAACRAEAATAVAQIPVDAGDAGAEMPPSTAARLRALDLSAACRRHAHAFAGHPNVRASFLHLSDLLEHHGPRLYPTHTMKDGGELRPRTFVARSLLHSPVGSSAAACADS